ncbi:MAG: hypothetical protein ACRDRI_20095 [Pseudonocardiaceae bacterium]
MAIVVAAAAGGSAGSEAAVSGAADGFSAGARISQSQEADEFSIRARTSRGRAEVRVRGSDDSVKATFRLRSLSRHPTTLNAESTTDCVSYSDGAAQRFLEEHRCVSLHRTLIEIRERNYTVRFATATIEMPDYLSTQDLSELLAKKGSGDITPLLPKGGKYPHFPFVSASSHTTWHDTVVINTRVQGLGRTPSTALVASLATSVLFSLD